MEPEPSIRQTGEDALVARLLPLMPSNPSLETGPGDDCAIIRGSGNRQLLLKRTAWWKACISCPERTRN